MSQSVFSALAAQNPPLCRSAWFLYRMRWKRRRLILRALRRRHDISRLRVDEAAIAAAPILAFSTVRNEIDRLPYFLNHHRALGVGHFLVVDNASTDGSDSYLAAQPDVSLWTTDASYKLARFGVDWLMCLKFRFGSGKWCLTLDADEALILPGARGLGDLVAHMDATGRPSFGVVMLDAYPKGSVSAGNHVPGENPFDHLCWFDADGYRARRHAVFDNLWVQGGVRDRVFFRDQPQRAPTLNKTPLVRWRRSYAYVTSTHQMLPLALNHVFDTDAPTGVLLHSKFLPQIAAKSAEELQRRQHFQNGDLYEIYHRALIAGPDLWHVASTRYDSPAQLEQLGLMSAGDWC
jgi:hypothetical protein